MQITFFGEMIATAMSSRQTYEGYNSNSALIGKCMSR